LHYGNVEEKNAFRQPNEWAFPLFRCCGLSISSSISCTNCQDPEITRNKHSLQL